MSSMCPPAASASGPLRLGTTTHFGQGWPLRYWPLVKSAGATTIRDAIAWSKTETVRGTYVFTALNSGHIQRACDAGVGVVLGLEPRNPLYDNGLTAFSIPARTAFATFVKQLADRFGNCIVAVEVGNEINGLSGITGPAALNRATSHVALLRDVYRIVKPSHPSLAILGGSTNAIGTGFLIDLFNAGALPFLDGIAVHPYRQEPENLDWELGRLTAAMVQRGNPKPIWATEFSRDFTSPAAAPLFLVKMTTLMSAVGVRDALWYALVDQKFFPTMGLHSVNGARKPVTDSFFFLSTKVLPNGQAYRENPGEPALFQFRFGPNWQILWGAPRAFSVAGSATYRGLQGQIIAKPAQIGSEPFFIEGAVTVRLGPRRVLADSRDDFGGALWSYSAKRGAGAEMMLRPVDWRFSSYIGNPAIKPIVVTPLGMSPAGGGRLAVKIAQTFRVTAPQTLFASACLFRKTTIGDGVTFEVRHNGVTATQANVVTAPYRTNMAIEAKAGDTISFVVGPNTRPVGDQVGYRFRVAADPGSAATC